MGVPYFNSSTIYPQNPMLIMKALVVRLRTSGLKCCILCQSELRQKPTSSASPTAQKVEYRGFCARCIGNNPRWSLMSCTLTHDPQTLNPEPERV